MTLQPRSRNFRFLEERRDLPKAAPNPPRRAAADTRSEFRARVSVFPGFRKFRGHHGSISCLWCLPAIGLAKAGVSWFQLPPSLRNHAESPAIAVPRVEAGVLVDDPSRVDRRVDLRGRDARVAKHLLNRAQVRPAAEQMRGE